MLHVCLLAEDMSLDWQNNIAINVIVKLSAAATAFSKEKCYSSTTEGMELHAGCQHVYFTQATSMFAFPFVMVLAKQLWRFSLLSKHFKVQNKFQLYPQIFMRTAYKKLNSQIAKNLERWGNLT